MRFIPAYAGNTIDGGGEVARQAVHPRLRGEHAGEGHDIETRHGSSPLTRGTPHLTEAQLQDHRFIPAYAGNTNDIPDTYTA